MGSRTYAARSIWCPRCHAAAGDPCSKSDGADMAGVHHERDIAYNVIHCAKPDGAEMKGSHSWMHRDLGHKPKVCVMCGTTDPWTPCTIDREVPPPADEPKETT